MRSFRDSRLTVRIVSPPAPTIEAELKRDPGFVISRAARRIWGRFGLSHSADEVVDALFGLPESEIRESAAGGIERPSWMVVRGRVFDHLIMIGGRKDARTGGWIAIERIAVVRTPKEGKDGT